MSDKSRTHFFRLLKRSPVSIRQALNFGRLETVFKFVVPRRFRQRFLRISFRQITSQVRRYSVFKVHRQTHRCRSDKPEFSQVLIDRHRDFLHQHPNPFIPHLLIRKRTDTERAENHAGRQREFQ